MGVCLPAPCTSTSPGIWTIAQLPESPSRLATRPATPWSAAGPPRIWRHAGRSYISMASIQTMFNRRSYWTQFGCALASPTSSFPPSFFSANKPGRRPIWWPSRGVQLKMVVQVRPAAMNGSSHESHCRAVVINRVSEVRARRFTYTWTAVNCGQARNATVRHSASLARVAAMTPSRTASLTAAF